MALLINSIQTEELSEYKLEKLTRSDDDELVDLNEVIMGWMSLYMEFDRVNEIKLRDESSEIIQGLIELRDNTILNKKSM